MLAAGPMLFARCTSAAAALMFPIALATAARLDASVMPFAIVIMIAASAGFATPIGYQTN